MSSYHMLKYLTAKLLRELSTTFKQMKPMCNIKRFSWRACAQKVNRKADDSYMCISVCMCVYETYHKRRNEVWPLYVVYCSLSLPWSETAWHVRQINFSMTTPSKQLQLREFFEFVFVCYFLFFLQRWQSQFNMDSGRGRSLFVTALGAQKSNWPETPQQFERPISRFVSKVNEL